MTEYSGVLDGKKIATDLLPTLVAIMGMAPLLVLENAEGDRTALLSLPMQDG